MQRATLEEERHAAAAAATALRGQVTELQHQLDAVQRESDAAQQQRDSEAAAAAARLDSLAAERDELRADLDAAHAEVRDSADPEQIDELQNALREAVRDYQALANELEALRAGAQAKEARIAELQAALREAGTESAAHRCARLLLLLLRCVWPR